MEQKCTGSKLIYNIIVTTNLLVLRMKKTVKKIRSFHHFQSKNLMKKYFAIITCWIFRKIRIRISTKNTRKKTYNVFGVIRGSIEPGEVIIIEYIYIYTKYFVAFIILIFFYYYEPNLRNLNHSLRNLVER